MLFCLLAKQLVSGILGGIDALLGLFIQPVVADDTVLVGMGARQQRRMANARVSRGVAVIAISVPSALVQEQLEPAFRVLVIILEQLVLRKAIHRHEHDEFGRGLARGCGLCDGGVRHGKKATERAGERNRTRDEMLHIRSSRRWFSKVFCRREYYVPKN